MKNSQTNRMHTTLLTFKNHTFRRLQILTVFIALMLVVVIAGIATPSTTRASVSSTSAAELTEWTVPTRASGIWGLTLDHSGNCCWFVEYLGNKVGHFDTSTGTIQEWAIPTPNANPYSLAITSISGKIVVWGTEFGSDKIFAFTPTDGVFQEYSIPEYHVGVGYISIEPSAQVRVWFTETTRDANGELIYNPATNNVTLYEDQFPAAVGGGAYGVYAAAGSVWFAGFSALVRWDRATQQYTMWPLPSHNSAVTRVITLDSYGQTWYTQGESSGRSTDNFVGVLRENNILQEWRIQSPGADPRGISINPITERPWIAEQSTVGNGTIATLTDFGSEIIPSIPTTSPSAPHPIVLSPVSTQAIVSTHTVLSTTTPVLGVKRGQYSEYGVGATLPHDTIVDASGNVWLSEPATNNIARLTVSTPDFALISSPSISLLQGDSRLTAIIGLPLSTYSGQVTLTSINALKGIEASTFNPGILKIPYNGNATSTLMINASPNATAGPNALIIEGTDGTVVHTISIILTITNSTSTSATKPQCLIATATYGSEMSPQVQLLRNFRDDVLKSKTGWAFLIMFNTWYYSFSPFIAQQISNNWIARIAMKGMLYPLIGSLYLASRVYNVLSTDPEAATLLSGLLASSLIGAIYLGIPLILLTRRTRIQLNQKVLSTLLLGGTITTLVSQIMNATFLLVISSSVTSLSVMFLAGAAVAMLSRKLALEKKRN